METKNIRIYKDRERSDKLDKSIEKCPGHLRRLVVTQTSGKTTNYYWCEKPVKRQLY